LRVQIHASGCWDPGKEVDGSDAEPCPGWQTSSAHRRKLKLRRIRVAAYCRVSTKYEEQLNSLNMQIESYTKYIKSNLNWKLAGIFVDKMSARTIRKRKQFQRMMNLCRANKIDLILTKSIKRFGRNTLDLLETFRELKRLHIEVFFELENMYVSDPKAELMFTIYASMTQEESENLSQDIKWGIHHVFRTGTSKLIGRPCYGYKQSSDQNGDCTLVIYEKEATVVRQIFKWRLMGYSLRQISKLLYIKGIPSPTGRLKWGPEALNQLLHNEKYTGNVMLQKTYVPDMLKVRQVKNNGQADMYYIENTHEAIIEASNVQTKIR
jgi:DNA invertase Pin-like site-specific DNA recombinase